MRQDYSRTAEGMALLRALEQFQPASRRIINDPYASRFLIKPYFKLPARSRLLANLPLPPLKLIITLGERAMADKLNLASLDDMVAYGLFNIACWPRRSDIQ